MRDNTVYQRVSDELARTATITVQDGTPDTSYPPANLVDENPARVAKIGSTTGAWLFDFAGVKTPVELVALIHHTFDEGLDVRLEGNDTNVWTSPSFSIALTVPAWKGTGIRRWPTNIFGDLTAEPDYDPAGWKFYRLAVIGTNSQNIQLGQIWLGAQFRYLDPDLQWSTTFSTSRIIVENKTAYNVSTLYGRGVVMWGQAGTLLQDDAQRADLLFQWHDAAGREHPFLWIPGPTDEAPEREPRFVRWATVDRNMERRIFDQNPWQIAVEEVSRGVRPGN